jgi:hypothetical protein
MCSFHLGQCWGGTWVNISAIALAGVTRQLAKQRACLRILRDSRSAMATGAVPLTSINQKEAS